MKDNKIMKFVGFVLLITVIALIVVAGTYAKYTSSATGSSSAVVAKWDIKAGKSGEEVSITGSNSTVAFNLFDTIKNEDGTEETDVVDGKIAPGTSGIIYTQKLARPIKKHTTKSTLTKAVSKLK